MSDFLMEPTNNIERAAQAIAGVIVEVLSEHPDRVIGALSACLSVCNAAADLGGAIEAALVDEGLTQPGDEAVMQAGEQVMLLGMLTLNALTERLIVLVPPGRDVPVAELRVGAFLTEASDE